MHKHAGTPAAVAIVLLVLSFAGSAAGGPNEQRLAQALFDDARRLMEQKRYAEACPKFAESQRLDPGGGTLLNLAVCHAGEGKTATALVEYNEALSIATRDGRRDREELARTGIANLEREVPRVIVAVPPASRVQGLEVKIDETPLPSVAWDVPMPVDPGSHSVVATVPGRAPWTTIVSVLPQERKTIEVPPLSASDPAPLPPPAPASFVVSEERRTMPVRPTTRANPVYIGLVIGTLTAAAASGVAGIFALTERSRAEEGCILERNWCRTAEGRSSADASTTYAWVSTGALALAAIGTIALLVVPSRKVVPRSSGRTFALEVTF